MQKETIAHTAEQNTDTTEDMISSLVAISIVAKRLAKQMSKNEPKGQKEETHINKCYGLVGKTIKVKYRKGDSDAYPWQGQAVPVLITGEYDNMHSRELMHMNFVNTRFFHQSESPGMIRQEILNSMMQRWKAAQKNTATLLWNHTKMQRNCAVTLSSS